MSSHLAVIYQLVVSTGFLTLPSARAGAQCLPAETFLGEQRGSSFAAAVAGAGDVNNDGCADVIVGDQGFGGVVGENSGKVYVYSGDTGDLVWSREGDTSWSSLGNAVDGAGDVNGDGYADVIVGAIGYDGLQSQAGRVYVLCGASGELLYSWDGEGFGHHFGGAVAAAGDVDNDGFADVVVGAPALGPTTHLPGKVYVYSGATGVLIWAWEGERPDDRFGMSVSGAGDVNNDGFDDLIVGAQWADGGAGSSSGKTYVFCGATGVPLWIREGEETANWFGSAVSGAGDVNGDGFADFIVGAFRYSGSTGIEAGKVYVFSGATGQVVWEWVGEGAGDFFGVGVSGAGDFDGDGFDDVIVGAYWGDGETESDSGKAYLYSGASGLLVRSWAGESFFDQFGRFVSGAGDVNNDGYADVIVGAHMFDGPAGNNSGKAYVYVGRPNGDFNCDGLVDAADLQILLLDWGCFVACATDLDGDSSVGIRDFLILLANWTA